MPGRAARIHTKVIAAPGSTFLPNESHIRKKAGKRSVHWARCWHRAGMGLLLGELEITMSPIMSKLQNNLEGVINRRRWDSCESQNLRSELQEGAAGWKGIRPLRSHPSGTFVALDAGRLQLQPRASSSCGPLDPEPACSKHHLGALG